MDYYLVMLIAVIVSACVFGILFNILNTSKLKLFLPIQNATQKLKRKKLFEFIALLIYVVLCTALKECFNLSYALDGILLGFFAALTSIAFGESAKAAK